MGLFSSEKKVEQKLEEMKSQNTKTYENEKRRLEDRLNELNMVITSSYEDKVFKRITEDTFIMISNKYEKEQLEIKEKLKGIIEEIEKVNRSNKNAINFTKLLTEFKETGTSELTQSTITNLIDRIIVYPSEILINDKGKKEKIQKIEISYRYIGCLELSNMWKEIYTYNIKAKILY